MTATEKTYRYEIVLDATGEEYGGLPDTYVVLYGDVDEGRQVVASDFPTQTEAQEYVDRIVEWTRTAPR